MSEKKDTCITSRESEYCVRLAIRVSMTSLKHEKKMASCSVILKHAYRPETEIENSVRPTKRLS